MGRYISAETCAKLQNDPDCIRNICILAHVDHGKTSLSDSLLASNGIISTKLAGKVRYLDSRPDEQLRGITMESSAISLYFRVLRKKEQAKQEDKSKESTLGSDNFVVNEHLINLIDSPGHIDFSSEVSAASRLCDGAVVLVDVVEGVCSQTVTVLRQCWTGNLKPVLVLNKLDRLITELQLDPLEAYNHLHRIIEQVNSVLGSFYTGDRALQDLSWREKLEQGNMSDFVEKDDSDLYFHPENNNVIFASAIDGWGFNVGQIAKFYESKLGVNREKLSKVLWGDYFYENKTKKILTRKALNGKNLKPLFVSFILDNIWRVYETVLGEFNDDYDHHHELDVAKLEKITKVLNVQLLPRDLRTKDFKNLLRNIMNQWLPVSTAVLLTAIEKLPSPKESQKKRLDAILEYTPNSELLDEKLRASMEHCDSNGPVAAYVSKILSIPREELPVKNTSPLGSNSPENDLFERARKAREEALKAGKNAELTERLAGVGTDDNKQNNTTKKKGEDIYKRAKESTTTPDIDELELNAKLAKKKQLSAQTGHFTPSVSAQNDEFKIVTAPAPEFDLGFEYEAESDGEEANNEDTEGEEEEEEEEEEEGEDENNEDFEIPEYIPTLDPNDPFSELFEYEDEDPFGNYEEDEEDEEDNDGGEEVLIGFARIYSGTLKVGQEIQVLEPKYNPLRPKEFIHTTTITELYLFMGKELIPLDEVPAGNIVGIGGLAGKILKNGTLIETGFQGVNLAGSSLHSQPIVRVALEPSNPTKMGRMVKGLRLLNQADPCVETFVNDHGEHILCTAGELHLERCLKDLTERFARVDITHSDPVIPYRETFLETDDMNPTKNPDGQRGEVKFYLGKYRVEISTTPLNEEVLEYIIHNESKIKFMNAKGFVDEKFKAKLVELLTPDCVNKIVGFGGKRCGPNILVSEKGLLAKYFDHASKASCLFADSIVNGFQLSCQEGPLCKEEVQGMMVVIKDVHEMTPEEIENIGIENYQLDIPDLSGRFITSTRQAIHQSFLDWSPRVMWAMYSCDIQASVDVLGKVYAVVQKRRGRIVSEELKEGTPFFEIEARVPVVEAFGFSEDIRKRTSGAAQPQLVFSGFEPIDLDPFWVPTTEEELEELGEFAERENIARRHMNTIRKRKGLLVDEKVVENAEKQRTLKRD
ncbi:hypothetical protein ACO0QE_001024 [Hanseniaspora vineae]